jgi:hypothetical protein
MARFDFNRKGHWMIYPGKIVVYLGEQIETQGLTKKDIGSLRDQVYEIVSGAVDAAIAERGPGREPDANG